MPRTIQEAKDLRKDQLEIIRKFTDKIFAASEKILRRRIEDLAEDTREGDGIFTHDQWSKKCDFAVKGNVEITVIVTARRTD